MPTRWERTIIALAVLAVAAKVFVAAGLPGSVATFLRILTAGAAVAALFLSKPQGRWLDGPRLVLLLLALYYLSSVHTRVGGDGVEYYVQSRSLLFDWDLELENDYHGLSAPPIRSAQGEVTSRFPVGLPLFWIPPLWLTHVSVSVASWLGADVKTDGFSPVYQVAVNVATYVYGFLALFLLEGALRRRHGRAIALLVVAAIWLATPLHFYMSANPFMSHGLSVLLATCFVLSWLKARENDDHAMWVVSGVFGGLMMLVRVQDAALLIMPVVDLVLGGRPQRLRLLVAFLAGPLLCGFFQGGIWLYLYGWDFVRVVFFHGKIGRTWPHAVAFLLSPRHGLLTWTPLFIGSLIGWGILSKRSPRVGLGVWLAFFAAVAINSSTGDWWGSESFGQRRMLGMLPVLALGLGFTFDYLRHRPLILLALAVAGLIGWNLQLGYIYNAELVSKRDEAATLERVAAAQVDLLYRKLLRAQEWMPRALWVLLYDNLKGVWIDEGSLSLNGRIDLGSEPEGYFPLVGEGWFPPEGKDGKDGITYRLSRGRRSWLAVPIRRPADSTLVLRARPATAEMPEMKAVEVRIRVDVNGEMIGEKDLTDDWSEYVFTVPRDFLHAGLNEVVLTYSATPRTSFPIFMVETLPRRWIGSSSVARAAADQLKKLHLELGGNDPFIVCDDVDVDVAAQGAAFAAFLNMGQVCTSAERFYVFEKVADRFLDRFVSVAKALRVGNPMGPDVELGPMVSAAQRDKVEQKLEAARKEGAELVTGGKRPQGLPKGYFFEPTVLTGVNHSMKLMNEETFGPIAPIMVVKDIDEATTLANDSKYGLGASIYTNNLEYAMTAAANIRAGTFWINDPLTDNDAGPFGGMRLSGIGRELGIEGLEGFRDTKHVHMDYKIRAMPDWFPYDWSSLKKS